MSKRKAATELNHENWNREEEPEVAGRFQEAPKEVVQGRVIRTASRRLKAGASASPGGEISNEPKKLFSSFTGFGAMKSSASPTSVSEIAKNSFSFLKKTDTPLKTNSDESKQDKTNELNEKYLAKLKGLNEAILDWIKQHVESNPCCILTPIFRDYDNYLKEIQSEKDSSSSSTGIQNANSFKFGLDSGKQTESFSKGSSNNSDKSSPAKAPMFSFGSNASEKPSVPTFSFGSKEASDKTSMPTNPLGSKESSEKLSKLPFPFLSKEPSEKKPQPSLFGSASKESAPAAPPSFGLIKNAGGDASSGPAEKKAFFNFGNNSTEKSSLKINFPSAPPGGNFTFSILNKGPESGGNAVSESVDDQEDQPEPTKAATEADAIFTQRVKLFVKKENNYSDLGVGNLFIKEAPNNRYQAIVRQDTSIGNIILNILLSSQHPTKRLGKNNVMIVCQPTPQHTGPAVPVLLRVKTLEDADKLLETIEKYKK